jgi:CTP synthase (UTP-ammonia lyase)
VNRATRIAIVADYDPKNKYHVATELSIAHAADVAGIDVTAHWVHTRTLDDSSILDGLSEYDAIWAGTSSPYASMDGALRAIRFARERGWPFFGT